MDKKSNTLLFVLSLAIIVAQAMDTLHYLLLEHSYSQTAVYQNVDAPQDNFFHHCDPKISKTFYTDTIDGYQSTDYVLNVSKEFDFSYQSPLKQASKNKLAQRGPPVKDIFNQQAT